MARPRLPIRADQVAELGRRGWPVREMAAFFGCTRWALYKRFRAELRQARAVRDLQRDLERCERERLEAEAKSEERDLLWLVRQMR